MRTTIDAAGRLVVPKSPRDELGFSAGTELELASVDGRLEIAVPSRVRVEDGPHGVRSRPKRPIRSIPSGSVS